MMENKNEARNLKEHISCDCKCKLNSTKRKIIISAKNYSWNPSSCICGNSKYLKKYC